MASALLSNAGLLSKFRGCLIGSLMGDCLGAPYEFDDEVSKTVLGKYFTKLLSGESNQIFSYTDDTAMTLSVAKSLIEKGEFDPRDMAEKFVSEFIKEPRRGYGKNVVDVFQALSDSEFEDVFLPAKLQFNGSGSYGNGSAMRISPIALFGSLKSESYLKNIVEQSSRLTHTNSLGYNGAILQAFAIHTALKSNAQDELDPVDYINQLQLKMQDVEIKANQTPYCDSLKKIKEIYLQKKNDISPKQIAEYLGNDVSAHESVPTAIYSFLKGMHPVTDFECSNPFVRSIYFAISVGGDTDTIASMAGSIAGAYYGVEGIPDVLQKRCEIIEEVNRLAEELYNTAVK